MAKQKKAPKFRPENLDQALKQIEKLYGKGAVMKMGDGVVEDVPVFSTGSPGLDIALGIGGIPRGRVIELYGGEGSGKTTLALQIVAEAQKVGGTAAFIDAEHAMDKKYARRLGVDIDDLLMSQPDCGEDALEITDLLVRSGDVDIIVIDSVAALVPKAELEGNMGDSLPGLQARLMSQALRKLTAVVAKSNTAVIFINQTRQMIGVMFGDPTTTSGGKALKFYASVRLAVRVTGKLKKGEAVIGNKLTIKVVKNKLAPPFEEADTVLIFGKGIDTWGELVNLAVKYKVFKKKGGWYSHGDKRLGQGRDNVIVALREKEEKSGKTLEWLKDSIAEARVDFDPDEEPVDDDEASG